MVLYHPGTRFSRVPFRFEKEKEGGMDDYHLLADFFSTWRSMNDTTKNIFIIGFYLTIIACLFGRYWLHEWLISRKELRRFYFENHAALAEHRKGEAELKDTKS